VEKKMILCDTNIFFGYFRGNQSIVNELSKIGFKNLAICSITIGEAFYGMKLSEKRKTKELINHFNIFEIQEDASKKFQEIIELLFFDNQIVIT
jgi:predicted nucleic acid-binding protein